MSDDQEALIGLPVGVNQIQDGIFGMKSDIEAIKAIARLHEDRLTDHEKRLVGLEKALA